MKKTLSEFSAVLLAGGRSTRMGRDKAAVAIAGQPLWRLQLATLHATRPAEVLISGRGDGPYAGSGLPIVEDITRDVGPLGALEAVIPRITTRHLLVLAIDLPQIPPDFLTRLAELALTADASVIPHAGERFEPLAAIYAVSLLPIVLECLLGPDHSMQNFLRQAAQHQRIIPYPVTTQELAFFKNLNSPEDL